MEQYQTLRELVAIDSPSGFADKASAYTFDLLSSYGYKPTYSAKGAVK